MDGHRVNENGKLKERAGEVISCNSSIIKVWPSWSRGISKCCRLSFGGKIWEQSRD